MEGQEEEERGRREEMIRCSICLEVFDTPKALIPCLHTFCEECLVIWLEAKKMKDKGACCPLCNDSIVVPDNEDIPSFVKKLPGNFLINNLIHHFLHHPHQGNIVLFPISLLPFFQNSRDLFFFFSPSMLNT